MNYWKSWTYLPNMIFRGVLWKKFESKVTYAENTNMLKYCTCVRKNIFSEKPMNQSAALWSSYWVLGQNHQKKIERFKNASLAGSMSATLSQKRVAFASASNFRHFPTINSWFSRYLNVAQELVLPSQVSEAIILCILGPELELKVAFMSAKLNFQGFP